jgi:hypothetical protein
LIGDVGGVGWDRTLAVSNKRKSVEAGQRRNEVQNPVRRGVVTA